MALLHPAGREKDRGAYPVSRPLHVLPTSLLLHIGTSGHRCCVCADPEAHCPFTSLCQPFPKFPSSLSPFFPSTPLLTPPHSSFLTCLVLSPLPFSSLSPLLSPPPPPTPQPRSLLGALAGLLLTEEPLDLRHSCCLALPRDKESSREGPSPPGGRCPLEGGGGEAGRGEAFTVA